MVEVKVFGKMEVVEYKERMVQYAQHPMGEREKKLNYLLNKTRGMLEKIDHYIIKDTLKEDELVKAFPYSEVLSRVETITIDGKVGRVERLNYNFDDNALEIYTDYPIDDPNSEEKYEKFKEELKKRYTIEVEGLEQLLNSFQN